MFPKEVSLEQLNASSANTLVAHLNIIYTKIEKDRLYATMPVDHRTKQPMGILHGGASVVLAETVGTMAAYLMVDREKYYCVGLSINANHMHKVLSGHVEAEARPLHIGRSTHVWQIHIHNAEQKLVCASRLTVAVLAKK